jgi:hypothetical protein
MGSVWVDNNDNNGMGEVRVCVHAMVTAASSQAKPKSFEDDV